MTTHRLPFPITLIVALLATLALACGDEVCEGDNCVCTGTEDCSHECAQGAAECHIQGGQGDVDVTCNQNAECHVQCATSTSCAVECGGSAECHVTCPATGCTVTNCVGTACVVSCGGIGAATRTGTTATCP